MQKLNTTINHHHSNIFNKKPIYLCVHYNFPDEDLSIQLIHTVADEAQPLEDLRKLEHYWIRTPTAWLSRTWLPSQSSPDHQPPFGKDGVLSFPQGGCGQQSDDQIPGKVIIEAVYAKEAHKTRDQGVGV